MQRSKITLGIFNVILVIVLLFGGVWLLLPSQAARATTQGSAREQSVRAAAPAAQATIVSLPTRPPTPGASSSAPSDVPEGDTLLLFGGGLGGLATWVGWQWRKARAAPASPRRGC